MLKEEGQFFPLEIVQHVKGGLQKQSAIDNNANLGLLALLLRILEKDPRLYNCSKLNCKYKWLCRGCHNHPSPHEMPDLTVDVLK